MFELHSSRPVFDRLFAGTLRSLVERVEANGFCHTSFGECGGVKCYGEHHYPRDAAEAARALALTGNVEKALAILKFNLASVPAGQRHLPHILNRNGSIHANTVQTDTLPHTVLALEACAGAAGETAEVAELRQTAIDFADMLWQDHFHAEASLLDSGNYNEQGFSGFREEPLLDLFSNASNYALCQALAPYEARFGERAALLAAGMEKRLFDPARGVYRPAVRLGEEQTDFPLNWITFYPVRWYCENPAPYRKAYEILWQTTGNDWGDGLLIPSCEEKTLSFRTMGKVVAVLLAFAAATGDAARLDLLLKFLETRIDKPADLWPECWFHHAPDLSNDYLKWFFGEAFKGVWTPYTEDPAADYTIDSGNCEQSSVFVTETVSHLAGVRRTGADTVELAPALDGFSTLDFSGFPCDGKEFSACWKKDGAKIRFELECHGGDLAILLPAWQQKITCRNGERINFDAIAKSHEGSFCVSQKSQTGAF